MEDFGTGGGSDLTWLLGKSTLAQSRSVGHDIHVSCLANCYAVILLYCYANTQTNEEDRDLTLGSLRSRFDNVDSLD